MSDSTFDPQSFLAFTTEEASTKRPPLPAGKDYVGSITDLKPRPWTKKDDPTKSGLALDVIIQIDLNAYPQEKDLTGTDRITLQDNIFLDTKDNDGKTIDMSPGKNSKLRRYREALGMNEPGKPFSFNMMIGRLIRVKIKHDPYEGEIYDRVDSIAKA